MRHASKRSRTRKAKAASPPLRLRLTLLGGFTARLGTGTPVVLASKKAQALLAYLALRPGQSHAREKLSHAELVGVE